MVVDCIGSLPLLDHAIHTGSDYLSAVEAECDALGSAIVSLEFLDHLGWWEIDCYFGSHILWHLIHLLLETCACFCVEPSRSAQWML